MGRAKRAADESAPEPEPVSLLTGDQLLRSRGFRVHARPLRGPALWERNGRVVWETVALDVAAREAAALAKAIKESNE